MINEVLYCERLLYLEWAQGEFADNAFTVEGRATHKRADQPGGHLPVPPTTVEAAPQGETATEPGVEPTDWKRSSRSAGSRSSLARGIEGAIPVPLATGASSS
jgi:hypothetical protein